MICVKLSGGLGNQMFQYAFGIALSKKTNSKLIFDKSFLKKKSRNANYTLRNYELDIFVGDTNDLNLFEKIKCKCLNIFRLTNYLNTFF